MTILHQVHIPDTPKGVNIQDCKCVHCGKILELGDAFTTREDGYNHRNEYVPCTDHWTED